MTGPGARSYLIAVCEGRHCVPVRDLGGLGGLPGGPPTEAEARALLARLAEALRARGVLGRAVLLDRESGAVVAARQLWP